MLKKIVDGVTVEMTPEDEAEYFAEQTQPAEPTPEERIAALEEQLAAAKILLGVDE